MYLPAHFHFESALGTTQSREESTFLAHPREYSDDW